VAHCTKVVERGGRLWLNVVFLVGVGPIVAVIILLVFLLILILISVLFRVLLLPILIILHLLAHKIGSVNFILIVEIRL
jgi:hypothetical protein